MDTTVLNEIFQWVVLAGLFLLMMALYRQYGLLVVDPREYLAGSFGPAVGSSAEERVLALFDADGVDPPWRLAIFVQENCSACESLLSQVERWPREELGLATAVVAKGGQDFLLELGGRLIDARIGHESAFLTDGEKIPAYPLSILISQDRLVRLKTIGGNGEALWTAMQPQPETEEVTSV